EVNKKQKLRLIQKLKNIFGNLNDKTVGVLGLSFKPNTDDIRDAVSLDVIEQLLVEGTKIKAHDPVAISNTKEVFPQLSYSKDVYDVAKDCDALIIVTEWDEYKKIDFMKMKDLMKDSILIDGRNLFDREELEKLGFHYEGIGR
ncbi:MAG TPA: UDP-glucose/GDP-mannose dehydrogenase family protein, partial [Actinobacteria bacterium]|nr:UDP-glucose/GDP-mannose dehydrogenase family protein [Actinomycetota bacterium]